MFTGLVEAIGTVASRRAGRLEIRADLADSLAEGESVAVDGCCLTALAPGRGTFAADLSAQTLALTTLGLLEVGARVNLERAAVAGSSRLGGHVVLGHVDAVLHVESVTREGAAARMRWAVPAADAALLVPRGSVAVNGVSLTVAELGATWFEAALVPHTLAATTLGAKEVGDAQNVEYDVLGKHVLRALALSGRVDLPDALRAKLGLG